MMMILVLETDERCLLLPLVVVAVEIRIKKAKTRDETFGVARFRLLVRDSKYTLTL